MRSLTSRNPSQSQRNSLRSYMSRMLLISSSSVVNFMRGSESRKASCQRVRPKPQLSRSIILPSMPIQSTQMLLLRTLRRFCDMKYYREIAAFLRIKVPLLNDEIKLPEDALCIVHGIKRLEPDPLLPLESPHPSPQSTEVTQQLDANQSIESPLPSVTVAAEPLYIYDQHSQEEVPFGKAMGLSAALKMDLNLLREGSANTYPVLAINAFRRHVYSQYYLSHVRRRGRDGWKSIRLGERIEDNDIRTKIANIQRMVKAGERRFRLEARNDSDRSQKMIEQFAQLLGKEVEPTIHIFTTPDRKKEERWVAMLEFDEEVPFEVDQVNKKWRRRQFQKQAPSETHQYLHSLFQDADIRAQRELYHAYKDLGIKMPPRFQKMAEDERNLESDKFAFFRSVQEEDQEQEWDSEEQAKFEQRMEKFNKQFFNERTASEIMEEMEALKNSGYESEAHKVARFKQLKAELQAIIKKRQDYDL